MQVPSLKILVGYHKPAVLIKDDVYMPIQLGRAIERETAFDGALSEEDIAWLHENMIGDDTGDNISGQNRKCSELSGMYWAWRNYEELGNPDYIGFMHYRRHFKIKEMQSAVQNADIILPYAEKLSCSLYEQYKASHNIEDLEYAVEVIKEKYPEYAPCLNILEKKICVFANMFIMRKELFFEYADWLFDIILALDKHIDYTAYSYYQCRAVSFVSERLLNIFVEKKNGESLRICYVLVQMPERHLSFKKIRKLFRDPYQFYADAKEPISCVRHLFRHRVSDCNKSKKSIPH